MRIILVRAIEHINISDFVLIQDPQEFVYEFRYIREN